MSLGVAYCTCRRDCRIEWFFSSLARQLTEPLTVIVVDFHTETEGRKKRVAGQFEALWKAGCELVHVAPKPTVWQGSHRLTKENWFAAASHRNTALCLCRNSHIAYVDDLSVLQPGWLNAALEAAELTGMITAGAYMKVQNLDVTDGIAHSYITNAGGIDNRLKHVIQDITPCGGNWIYGSSLVAPVDALLSIDGWAENLCDGMGFEDCCTGLVLANAGCGIRYDRRMMTLESDELHFVEPPMKRSDYGVSPDDKSHRALNIALQSKTFDNGYGEGGLRAERARVLRGEPFVIRGNPRHEWFTSTLLSEL